MSKIAFFCIPAHGHTNPTLGVVKELVNRGNEVWYYSYDTMKEKIESTGAKYISCDPYDIQMHLKPEDADRVGKDIAFSTERGCKKSCVYGEIIFSDMNQICRNLLSNSITFMLSNFFSDNSIANLLNHIQGF